jgi:hypothetical protein
MDAALQAMLTGQGEGGGMRLFGVFPNVEGMGLDAMVNPQSLNMEELLKKILPMMNQALVFNFPGGFLWQKIFKQIVEKLMQQIESGALSDGLGEGISGGASVSSGESVSPSAGGEKPAASISGHEM